MPSDKRLKITRSAVFSDTSVITGKTPVMYPVPDGADDLASKATIAFSDSVIISNHPLLLLSFPFFSPVSVDVTFS